MATQFDKFIELVRLGYTSEKIMVALHLDVRCYRYLRRTAIQLKRLDETAPIALTVREKASARYKARKCGEYSDDMPKPLYLRVRELRVKMAPAEVRKALGISEEQYKASLEYGRRRLGPIEKKLERKKTYAPRPPKPAVDPWAGVPRDAFSNSHFGRKVAE